jgi:nucleoside-diphosphate-sugar epimerase
MKVLMLGGTRFVGWHLAEAAIARGHEVTLFHRGQSRSAGPAGTQSVLGDRSTPTTPLPASNDRPPSWPIAWGATCSSPPFPFIAIARASV